MLVGSLLKREHESWKVLGNRQSGINTGSQVVGTPPPPLVVVTEYILFTSKRGWVKTKALRKTSYSNKGLRENQLMVHLTANVLCRIDIVVL